MQNKSSPPKGEPQADPDQEGWDHQSRGLLARNYRKSVRWADMLHTPVASFEPSRRGPAGCNVRAARAQLGGVVARPPAILRGVAPAPVGVAVEASVRRARGVVPSRVFGGAVWPGRLRGLAWTDP